MRAGKEELGGVRRTNRLINNDTQEGEIYEDQGRCSFPLVKMLFLCHNSGLQNNMTITDTETAALRLHAKDTGSADVQIIHLTQRISALTEHLKGHAKDHSSRRGLLALVAQRRRLLDYLKRTASERYQQLLQKLQLRK